MSVELLRERFKVNQVIGEDLTQTVVENDIIVPDVKPDVASILLLDGDVFIDGIEVTQDRLTVRGSIRYKIIYIADDEERSMNSMTASMAFTQGLDIPQARQDMSGKVRCEIEHLEHEILNGRKVNVKAVLKVSGKVLNEREINIAHGLEGLDDIQVLKSRFGLNSYLGRGSSVLSINEALDIPSGKPSIREILRNDIKISGKDYRVTDGKVVAKGDISITTLYMGDSEDRSIQYMEHGIPFTHSIDLPDLTSDAVCDIDYRICDMQFEAVEDSDGELRVLKADVNIDVDVLGYARKEVEILEDTYSPSSRINIEKETFKMEEFIADSRSQVVMKETLVIGDESREIMEVFNVLCTPVLTGCTVGEDKITLEGVVNSRVLYLAGSAEQPVICHQQDLPFKNVVEVKGAREGMNCEADLFIEHCNYSMTSSSEIELRLVVGASLRVMKLVSVPLIEKAAEAPLDGARLASQPSILIYFSKPGDTLWNIAKKYSTTIQDILKVNELDDNTSLKPGQQILIPKKAV